MQLGSLEGLEERIKHAIQRIDELQEKNKKMSSSYDLLSHQMSEFEGKSKALLDENVKLKEEIKKIDFKIKSKEQELKHRIENLIQKLSLLDNLD